MKPDDENLLRKSLTEIRIGNFILALLVIFIIAILAGAVN